MKVLATPDRPALLPGLDVVAPVQQPPPQPVSLKSVYIIEKRYNLQCVVVYRDDKLGQLYVHDVYCPERTHYTLQVIKYTKENYIFRLDVTQYTSILLLFFFIFLFLDNTALFEL